MLISEDLYLGDVRPSERSFKRSSQYAKALDDLVKAGDALTDTLTEKQKEMFEDYITAQREVNVLTDCETFIYAFRLSAKIIIDVLMDGTMKEIWQEQRQPRDADIRAPGPFHISVPDQRSLHAKMLFCRTIHSTRAALRRRSSNRTVPPSKPFCRASS